MCHNLSFDDNGYVQEVLEIISFDVVLLQFLALRKDPILVNAPKNMFVFSRNGGGH